MKEEKAQERMRQFAHDKLKESGRVMLEVSVMHQALDESVRKLNKALDNGTAIEIQDEYTRLLEALSYVRNKCKQLGEEKKG